MITVYTHSHPPTAPDITPSLFSSNFWRFQPCLPVLRTPKLHSVCGGGITDRCKNKLDKLIIRASSVLGCPLDSVGYVGERRILAKLSKSWNNPSHLVRDSEDLSLALSASECCTHSSKRNAIGGPLSLQWFNCITTVCHRTAAVFSFLCSHVTTCIFLVTVFFFLLFFF